MINASTSEVSEFLTEELLGKFLNNHFKEFSILHNPKLKINNKLYIPDYLLTLEDSKVIFEFNGPGHYKFSKTIIRDNHRRNILEANGFIVREIPYFFQLDQAYLSYLYRDLNLHPDFEPHSWMNYPHGFWADKVVFPSDFCSLGVERIQHEIKDIVANKQMFCHILKPFIMSIIQNINSKSLLEVVPVSWRSIFEEYQGVKTISHYDFKYIATKILKL